MAPGWNPRDKVRPSVISDLVTSRRRVAAAPVIEVGLRVEILRFWIRAPRPRAGLTLAGTVHQTGRLMNIPHGVSIRQRTEVGRRKVTGTVPDPTGRRHELQLQDRKIWCFIEGQYIEAEPGFDVLHCQLEVELVESVVRIEFHHIGCDGRSFAELHPPAEDEPIVRPPTVTDLQRPAAIEGTSFEKRPRLGGLVTAGGQGSQGSLAIVRPSPVGLAVEDHA